MKTIQYLLYLCVWTHLTMSTAYSQQNPSEAEESVHLHLAEEVWLSGQTAWFTGYLSEKGYFPPQQGGSQVLYVELLNRAQQPVLSSKLKLSGGMAPGTFQIPDTLSSGWYQLRAYTQWMRNFPASHFFNKEILVINPFQSQIPESLVKTDSPSQPLFFPEGGQWVAGVENHMVVQLPASLIAEASLEATVHNEADSLLATVQWVGQGLGSFRLQPQRAETYHLQLITGGDTLRYPLPPPRAQGFALQVSQQQEAVKVTLLNAQDSLAVGIFLQALSHGEIVWRKPLQEITSTVGASTEGEGDTCSRWQIHLPDTLFEGPVGQIVLVTDQGEQLAGRLFSITQRAQPADNELTIALAQKTYQPREKVQLHLSVTDGVDPAVTKASLTVRKVNPLSENSIPSSLPLEGSAAAWWDAWWITQPGQALENSGEVFEPLLKTHAKEEESFLLSGQLTDGQGVPLADHMLLFSIPGTDPKFDYYVTDEQGQFFFPVKNVYEAQEVILQLPGKEEGYQIRLDEKFASPAAATFKPPVLSEEVLAHFIEESKKRAEIHQIYSLYTQDTILSDQASAKETPFRFYGAPNFVRNLDDYISLPTFEEVCREIMPGIMLKKDKEHYHLDVFDVRTREFLPDEPMLLIDGVPVFDVDRLVRMVPDTIRRLETVNRRTYYGEFALNGTIAVYSKSGKEYLSFLSPRAFRQTVAFYARPEQFARIFPEAIAPIEGHSPDFRTLLYWEPNLTFDAQGKASLEFFNAYETGTFEVIVEGISKGKPFHQRLLYEVVLAAD